MPRSVNNDGISEHKEENVKEVSFEPSTIETIDAALTEYVDQALNIFCTTNEGWKKVPIVWTSAERSYQIKNKKELRDDSGVIIKPVISIERASITKDLSDRATIFSNIPVNKADEKGGTITIARKIKQDKTRNYQNARSKRLYGQTNHRDGVAKKTVYETITIPVPVYVQVMYNVVLYTEYQQQMNEILTPFITRTNTINSFPLRRDGHFYEGFIQQQFTQANNASNLSSEERKYQTTVQIKVLAYIVGEGDNQERPKIVKRENFVDVKIPRERVIQGDINEYLRKNGFYRE
jgi:hypothetical protein